MANVSLSHEASDFMRTSETLGPQIHFDWMPWDHPRALAASPGQSCSDGRRGIWVFIAALRPDMRSSIACW